MGGGGRLDDPSSSSLGQIVQRAEMPEAVRSEFGISKGGDAHGHGIGIGIVGDVEEGNTERRPCFGSSCWRAPCWVTSYCKPFNSETSRS